MSRTVDQQKLERFLEKAVADFGGALQMNLAVIGEQLGLYRAMADGRPVTSEELARKTGAGERYVREWLAAHAAGGYVEYDAGTGRFHMTPEQAFALADPDGLDLCAGFNLMSALVRDQPKITETFRGERRLGWHDHDPGLYLGTERFFKPTYVMNLLTSWVPALDGVEERLRSGGRVADVGCGHGASTILMAGAFPKSTFIGFDYHAPSIETARRRAEAAGMNGNLSFERAGAKEFPGKDYDLVTLFDCLHDMGDPVGAARHAKEALRPDGVLMLVEPQARDRLEENLNPVGRVYYGASSMVCTPASLAQEGGLALGAQAGEERLRGVLREAGFRSVRRAAETPFNMVLEAKP